MENSRINVSKQLLEQIQNKCGDFVIESQPAGIIAKQIMEHCSFSQLPHKDKIIFNIIYVLAGLTLDDKVVTIGETREHPIHGDIVSLKYYPLDEQVLISYDTYKDDKLIPLSAWLSYPMSETNAREKFPQVSEKEIVGRHDIVIHEEERIAIMPPFLNKLSLIRFMKDNTRTSLLEAKNKIEYSIANDKTIILPKLKSGVSKFDFISNLEKLSANPATIFKKKDNVIYNTPDNWGYVMIVSNDCYDPMHKIISSFFNLFHHYTYYTLGSIRKLSVLAINKQPICVYMNKSEMKTFINDKDLKSYATFKEIDTVQFDEDN